MLLRIIVAVFSLTLVSSFRISSKPSLRLNTAARGFFDDIKLIFSPEGQKNIKEFNDREKEEQLKIQKEILERRKDPKKMREYEESRSAKRQILANEKALYEFQRKDIEEGYDPLTDWKKLKDEGKIKMSKDLKRDEGSSRLGSEGLIEVRLDERMPYIDQGYVDEDSDIMSKLGNLFGGGKKNKKKE